MPDPLSIKTQTPSSLGKSSTGVSKNNSELETYLMQKIQSLEEKVENLSKTKSQQKTDLQNSILSAHESLLKKERGKHVAFTYAGKMIASSKGRVELLQKLKEIGMLNEQVFVYAVVPKK